VVTGTLADIADRVRDAGLKSPVITVVGEVVSLREEGLVWFDTRPLFGKRILVTRSRAQASMLSQLLADAGAVPVEFPVIRCTPLPAPPDLRARLARADWIVFTSANGLPSLLSQLREIGADIRALGNAKLAAIGPATAASLAEHQLHVDYMAERFIAESLAQGFPDPNGQDVVVARAEEAREVLPETLMDRGATVDVLPVYRTVPEAAETPDLADIDAITFTSSSTVRNFRALVPGPVEGPVIACIGPVTAETAREMGLRVDIEAEEFTVPRLVEALIAYFAERG
jgi:uroporphyrinogen III methyltransferase/synthase